MIKLYKELDGKPCHIYMDEDRPAVQFDSLSHVVGKYKAPFTKTPGECFANPRSKWYNFPGGPEAIQEAWEQKSKFNLDRGTAMHLAIENYQLRAILPHEDYLREQVKNVVKLYKFLGYDIHAPQLQAEVILEKPVAADWSLTGTIDCRWMKFNESTMTCQYSLFDYKQDEDINKKAFDNFLNPLGHVPYTNLNAYFIKMWAYAMMTEFELKKLGYTPELKHNFIFWWNRDMRSFSRIEVPIEFREYSRRLLNHYFTNRLNREKNTTQKQPLRG